MSLTVKYIDSPAGAQESGRTDSVNAQPFSGNVLEDSINYPIATLEDGGWPLDGSRKIMQDNPSDIGWWSSSMSDASGRFSATPKFDIVFPVPFASTGFMFTFSPATNQWCSEIRVSWYSKQALLKRSSYYPDSPRWLLEELIDGFDRIVVEIIRTSEPFQFAKIQNITLGQTITFDRNDIISANISSEADHKLCELTVDTMKLQIRDREKRDLLPQKNQRVELYQNDNLIAAHYINDIVRDSPYFYTLTCNSAIGLLDVEFLGGMYDKVPLPVILGDILGSIRYEISSAFVGVTVSGYLPVCTKREALQQVAFAVGAIVSTHGTDAIKLNPISETIKAPFNDGSIFVGATLSEENRYARVEVLRHSYIKMQESEELVQDEYINGTDILITFDEPHYDYTITGGTITASSANWVTVTARGNVSISGKKFMHNTVKKTRRNQFATAGEQGNVLRVEDATLVTADNVDQVLARLYEASTLRSVLNEDVVVNGQVCGDRVSSINPWGTQTRGFITAMSSDYTQNKQTASITICGIQVEKEPVYYYSGELYSGDSGVYY